MSCKTLIFSFLAVILLRGQVLSAQPIAIEKLHPLNWYVGMKNPNVQLLIYGKNIAATTVGLKPYGGVKLGKIQKVENPNYLFVDLTIDKTAKAGNVKLVFSKKGETTLTRLFELKNRSAKPKGLTQADLIYMLMPDRFANADPSNDRFLTMRDTVLDRNAPSLRHGGDLLGVQNHLDYIAELGATALWMTPILENNQPINIYNGKPESAYHGYSFTDHYAVDARFGGNDAYKKLADAAHARGLKVVQDAVYNHVSIDHWFIRDMPMRDWVHQWASFTQSSHRNQTLVDPHGSAADKKQMLDGWFVTTMPDMNQLNPLLATYLIQHAIWSTEYFGVDAWRIDTYMYCDLKFMNRCNKALIDEFPNIFMFGESWVESVLNQSYFVKNNLNVPFKSNQLGGCDFQIFNAMLDGLRGKELNVSRLYKTLAEDYVYQDATRNVIFLENHDTDRFLAVIGDDAKKFKIGVSWLLTLRGIPQAYYGTEVLMNKNKGRTDGDVREDFVGGWAGDKTNKFTSAGRSAAENEAFNFFKKLATYRKTSAALTTGKLLQFAPKNNIYVYFRYAGNQRVMVVSNLNETEMDVKTDFYAEILRGATSGKNVLTDEKISDLARLKLPPMTTWVIEIE